MLVILYGLLLGVMTALVMCAPYTYYPLLLSLVAVSAAVYALSRKFFKTPSRKSYIYAAAIYLIFYIICTYTIFTPADYTDINTSNIQHNKKAVIFYCEGEMEKYTPYYAKSFISDSPMLLKPFYAYRIKNIYRKIGVNTKNEQLTNVAQQVRSSILNYKPYLFYIAFSNYTPSARDSIYSAIADGCSEIVIINYTEKENIEKEIYSLIDIDKIKSAGICVKLTKSAASTDTFINYMLSRIVNLPVKPDAVWLIGNEGTAAVSIKKQLMNNGYDENRIIISTDLQSSIKYFLQNKMENLLYINIMDSSSGLFSDVVIPEFLGRYSGQIKITGIKDWGYDKKLVKACIEVFLDADSN